MKSINIAFEFNIFFFKIYDLLLFILLNITNKKYACMKLFLFLIILILFYDSNN